MDALTHAIEGYTTKAAWEMTDMFHLKAIEIISKSLRGAVENTKEGREGMALGQYIAGMGFSNVGLGIAHSMAHTLGAVYDTPHGVACAMMLPIVMEYNQECTGEKYREIARAMGVKGVDEMTQLMNIEKQQLMLLNNYRLMLESLQSLMQSKKMIYLSLLNLLLQMLAHLEILKMQALKI